MFPQGTDLPGFLGQHGYTAPVPSGELASLEIDLSSRSPVIPEIAEYRESESSLKECVVIPRVLTGEKVRYAGRFIDSD